MKKYTVEDAVRDLATVGSNDREKMTEAFAKCTVAALKTYINISDTRGFKKEDYVTAACYKLIYQKWRQGLLSQQQEN